LKQVRLFLLRFASEESFELRFFFHLQVESKLTDVPYSSRCSSCNFGVIDFRCFTAVLFYYFCFEPLT